MNDKFFDLKKDKQDRIINAALQVFALNGYRHASTDDIVKLASKYLEIANQKDVISFAAGIASFENLPTQAFEGIEAELLSRQKELLVSPVAGFSSLRKVISTYMQKRSCFCQPSEIMVLSGSQQGIDLITRAFINPGDLILIEEPSFFPAIQSFRAAGAKIMAVPMENDGMDMEILEQLLSRYRPGLNYSGFPGCLTGNRNP